MRRFWDAYANAAGVKRRTPSVVRFGDSNELADEHAMLVIAGTKRAHASLPCDFSARGRKLPRQGDLSGLLNGARKPRCVIRYVSVEVKPLRDVDERFAWDAGGGIAVCSGGWPRTHGISADKWREKAFPWMPIPTWCSSVFKL